MLGVLDPTREDNRETSEGAVPTLDELAREGGRRMLMAVLEAEVEQYIETHTAARDADGRRLVVRNGRAQSRKVTCGAGTMKVRAPRVNDRRVDDEGERQRFTGRILPPYMRRSPQVGRGASAAVSARVVEARIVRSARAPGCRRTGGRRGAPQRTAGVPDGARDAAEGHGPLGPAEELGLAAVPHGFRSSFRDWAEEETDHPRAVVEAALAHTVRNPVEAAYARSDLFERRRRLMTTGPATSPAGPASARSPGPRRGRPSRGRRRRRRRGDAGVAVDAAEGDLERCAGRRWVGKPSRDARPPARTTASRRR